MAKRIKNSIRSKRSGLKLESLEQRQLLASIVAGSGTEVDTDVEVVRADGSSGVYDQILLTGSTVTVTADTVDGVAQVTRVDFLDTNGDIVRAEFSGAGTLTVTLDDFKDAAAPENYATTTEYVSGRASFRIEGSDETTNFSVFSLGSENVHDKAANPIFDNGNKTGGDNVADVARIVIESDGSVLGNAFGGIRAGNALFSDDSGAVGIIAPNAQFQGPIIIGDIDASGNATAVLDIGQYSSNKVVTVAGGNLDQTTGTLALTNVDSLISTTGSTSFGELQETQIIETANVPGLVASDITYTSAAAKVVIDGSTVTQAELDAYKNQFLNEVVIENGLKAGLVFRAQLFGDITVNGDLAGLITTDIDNDNVSDTSEFGIGDVSITGKIVKGGAIEASTSIGDIEVTGGINFEGVNDSLNANAVALISTLGRASLDASIGNIAFGADVKLDNEATPLIVAALAGNVVGSGNVGNISGTVLSGGPAGVIVNSEGSIGNLTFTKAINIGDVTAANNVGTISGTAVTLGTVTGTGGNVGAITSTDGSITITGISAGKAVGAINSDGALTIGATGITAAKSVGDLKANDGAMTLTGKVDANDGGIGAIWSDGNLTVTAGLEATGAIGAITVDDGNLDIDAAISGKSIGAITLNKGGALLDIGANITATGGNIGTISVSGSTDNAAKIDFTAVATVSATGGIDGISVNGGTIEGQTTNIEFSANTIGEVSVVGHKADATALLTDVIFRAQGLTESAVGSASIGDIVLDNSANNQAISISTAAATADTGTGFSSSGSIGDITLKTGATGTLTANATSSLIFRAGSSLLGESTDTGGDNAATYALGTDANGGVSIGDVTIEANLAPASGNAGTGLVIAAGVDLGADGAFVTGAGGGAAVATATKLGTSTIGTVEISDLGGTAAIEGFASNNAATAAAFTGGSAIIADSIGAITLTSGVAYDPVNPTGLPLKGVIDVTDDGATSDDLFVIVL